jgi:hypothetical protein
MNQLMPQLALVGMLGEARPLIAREPGALAPVDLGLAHPVPQGLRSDPELARDPGNDPERLPLGGDRLGDHPDRPLLELGRVPLLGVVGS